MTMEQAAAFIRAFNATHPYVPPILFAPLADSDVLKLVLAVANGNITLNIAPPVAPAQSAKQE